MKPIKVTDHKYKDEHRDNNNEKKKHVLRRRHLSTASGKKTKLNKIVAMIVGEYLKGTRNRLPIDNPPGRSCASVCERSHTRTITPALTDVVCPSVYLPTSI